MAIQTLSVMPGIQRDGSVMDATRYVDGEWVRFQRGRPKKMNGYRRINNAVNGPVYGIHVWNRQETNLITTFSSSGIEQIQVDNQFVGSVIYDRTPAIWVNDPEILWQFTTLYDDAAGSDKSLLIAHPGRNLRNIDDGTPVDIYYADANSNGKFVAMGPEWRVSGGVVAAAPYLVAYGSDGKVIWSNQNEPRNATTGDAGSDRITDKKIVKGLPIRGSGNSPSILLWTIDSVIRMSYIGGPAVFKFDTLTSESSVLSTNSIIEYDGVFYWVGLGRFMVYNGAVQELPNDTNLNYFFDNLNFEHRQKVFAMKVPRYGEIWWFYPTMGEEECNRAVIYNVREKVWYDVNLNRTAGSSSQSVRNPVMTDSEEIINSVRLELTGITGELLYGDALTGDFSGASGRVVKVTGNTVYLSNVSGTFRSDPTEDITGPHGSGTVVNIYSTVQHSLWIHETGKNKVAGDDELSIRSFVETSDIGFLGGSPATPGGAAPEDIQTRLVKMEPDFVQEGPIALHIITQRTAHGLVSVSRDYLINNNTEYLTFKEQGRIMRLRFSNDSLNGDYEMGKILIDTAPGDKKL